MGTYRQLLREEFASQVFALLAVIVRSRRKFIRIFISTEVNPD